jgi:hypothetical protein
MKSSEGLESQSLKSLEVLMSVVNSLYTANTSYIFDVFVGVVWCFSEFAANSNFPLTLHVIRFFPKNINTLVH